MSDSEFPDENAGLRLKIEQFLFLEAQLADENRYEDWLALWAADDCTYWVPCNDDDVDPEHHVSIIYDDRTRLEDRVFRLSRPSAHSQDPATRMRRLISNIVIEDRRDERGRILTSANFLISTVRRGRQEAYAGRAHHVLALDGAEIRIHAKRVLLVNNDVPVGNVTFLL